MLAPALGESITRWEATASGFSGHGFDDAQKERFDPPDPSPEDALRRPTPAGYSVGLWGVAAGAYQGTADWAREKRTIGVQRVSEGFKTARAKWFGWRLQMKQVEHDEVVPGRQRQEPVRDATNGPQAGKPTSQIHEDQEEQPSTRKRKSWVWEWSRNKPS